MRDASSIANRRERLRVILKLLRENRVESQEEMLVILETQGIFITQATLSRDLKLLKVSKVGAGSEGYFYAVPSDDEVRRREEIHGQDFVRGYVSIDWNEQFVVIKTFSGHSAPVALALVNLGLIHRDNEVIPYWDAWLGWMRQQGWRGLGWDRWG